MSLRLHAHTHFLRGLVLVALFVSVPAATRAQEELRQDDPDQMHTTADPLLDSSAPRVKSREQAAPARRIQYPAGLTGEHITVDIPAGWTDVPEEIFDRIDALAEKVRDEGGATALITAVEFMPRNQADGYALFTITAMLGKKYTATELASYERVADAELSAPTRASIPGVPFSYEQIRYDRERNIIWTKGEIKSGGNLATLTAIIPTEVGSLVIQGMSDRLAVHRATFHEMIERVRVSEPLRYRSETAPPERETAPDPAIAEVSPPPAEVVPEPAPAEKSGISAWGTFIGLLACLFLVLTWLRLERTATSAAARTTQKALAFVVVAAVMSLLVEDLPQGVDAGRAFLAGLIALALLRALAGIFRHKAQPH